MKTHTVLGIDPGIANTGLTIVQGETRYQLVDTHHITTDPNSTRLIWATATPFRYATLRPSSPPVKSFGRRTFEYVCIIDGDW